MVSEIRNANTRTHKPRVRGVKAEERIKEREIVININKRDI